MSAMDPRCPIKFDVEMNEYHITFNEPSQGHYLMRYCFSCGGQMPESKRSTFFMDLDELEVKQIREVMKNVATVEVMLQKLGPADRIHEWIDEGFEHTMEIEKWKTQYTYNLWKSVSLGVHVKDDRSISYLYYPKPKK